MTFSSEQDAKMKDSSFVGIDAILEKSCPCTFMHQYPNQGMYKAFVRRLLFVMTNFEKQVDLNALNSSTYLCESYLRSCNFTPTAINMPHNSSGLIS